MTALTGCPFIIPPRVISCIDIPRAMTRAPPCSLLIMAAHCCPESSSLARMPHTTKSCIQSRKEYECAPPWALISGPQAGGSGTRCNLALRWFPPPAWKGFCGAPCGFPPGLFININNENMPSVAKEVIKSSVVLSEMYVAALPLRFSPSAHGTMQAKHICCNHSVGRRTV